MPVNPMQRKARNSFILGFLIALIILSIPLGILMLQLLKPEQKVKTKIYDVTYLTVDVEAGTPILAEYLAHIPLEIEQGLSIASPTNMVIISDIGNEKSYYAKIDLKANTMLTSDMIYEEDIEVANDARTQEFNMITIKSDLQIDDYIDIRLMLPNGEDYLVVSKKRILSADEDTISFNLSEIEIATMSNAIVENYMMQGSNLYAVNYIEPGLQDAAIPNYIPNSVVLGILQRNPNILDTAKSKLSERINAGANYNRANIDATLIGIEAEEKKQNEITGTNNQITKSREKRQEYIDMLNAPIEDPIG